MRRIFACLLALMILPCAANAGSWNTPANDANEAMLGLYAGEYSTIRDSKDQSPMFGAEYRYKDVYHGIRPTVEGFVTGDGTLYGSAGINWDLPLGTAPFFITPGFGVGLYGANNGKDLGWPIEFRSSLELSYQFDNHQRFGVAISHLSNASLGNKNPGVETLQAVYSAPLTYFVP